MNHAVKVARSTYGIAITKKLGFPSKPLNKKSVEIKYKNYQGVYSERVIKPIKFEMVERKKNWMDNS